MDQLQDNPYLQQEDYFAQYNKSVESLKNHPELIQFDKLCYEVFNTEFGKKFMEFIQERYLIPNLVHRDAPNYSNLLIWADGFKDGFRMILQNIRSHEQRIKAESTPK